MFPYSISHDKLPYASMLMFSCSDAFMLPICSLRHVSYVSIIHASCFMLHAHTCSSLISFMLHVMLHVMLHASCFMLHASCARHAS
jgi:hypothetical protein